MAKETKLVIVESPTKARKIQGYLGSDYTVLASVGHIRDLAQPSQIPSSEKAEYGKFGVDVNDQFKPYYIINPDKKAKVTELKKALSHADELYLATDEDREGEAIAWHLVQTLKPKVPVKRMVFHEITKDAILDSLQHTREINQNMVSAQETRRILDRLYGYELSPVLWRKVAPKLSAGRVQSVATRLIVERERERMEFCAATYRDVVARVSTVVPNETHREGNASEGPTFEAKLVALNNSRLITSKDFGEDGKLTAKAQESQPVQLSQEDVDSIAKQLLDTPLSVESIEEKPYTRRPAPPFTTSTLQQAAGNRLGMSSSATMRTAQMLYENGYITYMRTDSVVLSTEAIEAAREAAKAAFGAELVDSQPRHYTTKTAGAQEAHEAIRPAGTRFRSPDELTSLPPDQLRLYTLIWQRTLASQMKDVKGSTEIVMLNTSLTQGEARLQASGTVITSLGYMAVYNKHLSQLEKPVSDPINAEDEGELPQMKEGQIVYALSAEAQSHETVPPARYTEASLVKTLEAKEIGRPSTYASIISTIIDRGYVHRRARALVPSWLAFSVVKLLEQKFPRLVNYEFTARLEQDLDNIAQGEDSLEDRLESFYFGRGRDAGTEKLVAAQGLQAQVAELGDIDARAINTIAIGDGINVRVGRFGPYVEDTAHQDKEGNPLRVSVPEDIAPDELTVEKARNLLTSQSQDGRILGMNETGNIIEVRVGRFGPYVAEMPIKDDEQTSDYEEDTSSVKPVKMASLFQTMSPETITLEEAIKLLSLPRVVGTYTQENSETHQEDTYEITASNGRYGPYITKTKKDSSDKADTRSLDSQDEIFTITLEQAQERFNRPKYGKGSRTPKPPLRELGQDPETGKPVVIKDGFYGAYITDGETNRTLPREYTAATIPLEVAFSLLSQKRAQGPVQRKKTTRKTTTKKATTTKTAVKKTAVKKTAETTEVTMATTPKTTTKKATTTEVVHEAVIE